MLVKVLPIKGTTMHVWDTKKYYPGEIKAVDDDLGNMLLKHRIVEQLPEQEQKEKKVEEKRGPGRPRKTWGG